MRMFGSKGQRCRAEFHCRQCGFNHDPPEDLVRSQWQRRNKSGLYLVYRWLIAALFIAAVAVSMSGNATASDWGFYFIYLTNWGIVACMVTTTMGAILVSLWHFHPQFSARVEVEGVVPTAFKVYWALHNSTLVMSIIITIIYWSILFDAEIHIADATNVMTHATNSVFMFLDILIVAYPVRIYHAVHSLIFGLIYVIFSVIYFAAGGTTKSGATYIYSVLDWNDPGSAMITVVGVCALGIIIHTILYLIYLLRTWIFRRYFEKEEIMPTTSPASTLPGHGISMVLGQFGQDNRAFTTSTEKLSYTTEKY
ncbi:protein rolling stone-like [Phlebotomus argentipes]|uniref:protein rolling stone-like n=1 Tax=Phlebotomus argentipes TaxID=94469 RepID=UPI002892B976|nr:protein rolling stone-like [Phlebotomus argentipes]XP_059616900.1 protein rolling stone-like [Phlebotomus argentipes]